MSLKDKVRKLADDVPYVNMLVYGDSGVGKTVLGGSDDTALFAAPEDSGTLSAVRTGSKADKYPIEKWEDLMALYDDLQELVEEDKPIPYQWLIIDSITEMQAMCMRYILRRVVAENPDRDPDIPALQDWQRYYILFEKMVRAFNDLPINVLYTALARKVEDSDGNEFMVPEIQGKDYGIAMKMVSYMTCYGYMMREVVEEDRPDPETPGETKKVKVRKRVIFFEDNGPYKGKDRTMTLGTKYVLPGKNALKSIRLAIQGYKAPEPAKAIAKKAAPVKATPPSPAKKAAGQVKTTGDGNNTPQQPNEAPKLTGEVGQKFPDPNPETEAADEVARSTETSSELEVATVKA